MAVRCPNGVGTRARLILAFGDDLVDKHGRLDSSVGRASPLGAGGRGFETRPHHTKGVKNGTSSSLADARIKEAVLGR